MILNFTACAKSKKSNEVQTEAAAQPVQTVANPEIEKLNKVLLSMTDRCKAAIPNGDPEEFLADLHKVLDSIADFSSEDLSPFYLIDKTHTVSSTYEPKGLIHLENCSAYKVNKNNLSLRPEAYKALGELGTAAKADGVTLTISSTYRSYDYQKNLFDYWVSVDGLEEAERESARPGTSQHQLGMALDFAPVDDAFDKTPGGKWVYENAAKYGWSLSFPQGYEDVTGYRWECWHFRYIGVTACQFQKKWFGDVQQFMIEFLNAWEMSS
ncbi:M15 family metallopeptidase [Treponema bryantii]|nr:M15 family metallopeptidase [Treponema bryantii]